MDETHECDDAPQWRMDDAYGEPGGERFLLSLAELERAAATLAPAGKDEAALAAALAHYDRAQTLSQSLANFLKCWGAKDTTDERVGRESARVRAASLALERAAAPLFDALLAKPEDWDAWTRAPFAAWRYEIACRRTHWKRNLSRDALAAVESLEAGVFLPLGDVFKKLQKGVDFEARNARGKLERVKAAKMVAVVKGSPDRVLRESVAAGLAQHYGREAESYASLLNALHGFRLSAYKLAGTTPLAVSLHQNRMSEAALSAMREAILANVEAIRRAVTLRAPFFGTEKLAVFDLMAPMPALAGAQTAYTYAQAMAEVKKALAGVSGEMSDFVDMMLRNRWIDAKPSDLKTGGAFYSRFDEFKMPRVFSTFTGSITAVLQQGHELGHAFHYWVMRDLPTVLTAFPMTLTETASTFNEALLRRHLAASATSARDRFAMRWQELRGLANFTLNTMTRMDFELAFLREREAGAVESARACELMRQAWKTWYGDSTTGADDWLWAYKLHYYKTDQLIYNYPYTVGYLLSQGLVGELERRGEAFYPFYKALLRDTGAASVDEVVAKHFGADARDPAFWGACLKAPVEAVAAFEGEAVEFLK